MNDLLTFCFAQFDSNEDDKLLQYADIWQDQLFLMHPKRVYKTTVVDINAKCVFVTRYLKPLKPPAELLEGAASEQEQAVSALRFHGQYTYIVQNDLLDNIIYHVLWLGSVCFNLYMSCY